MELISSIQQLQERIAAHRKEDGSVGFVPTMGFLHEGHLSLVEKAKAENSLVVMSIFVNPLQFGPGEDFERYPRDKKRDTQLAQEAGVDILFLPQAEEMYPRPLSMKVVVEKGIDVLCGEKRPGHFDGVATVVLKLFQIVKPTNAYFGMKDAQQVAVIENMIQDFNLSVRLVRCDTLREADGLAKSSRNVNLTPKERDEAAVLYESLQRAKQIIASGEKKPSVVLEGMKQLLDNKTTGVIDYIQILSYPKLTELHSLQGNVIIALAVKFSQARLIDNIVVDIEGVNR